jgi:hypothetical protein
VELENKTHREVARVLRQAALHVNVNCQESFNATVPEAMAAGCIPRRSAGGTICAMAKTRTSFRRTMPTLLSSARSN